MTPTNKDIATIAILDTKLDGAITQIADLKVRFDTFQSNFIRQDVYNIKHEELVKQVTENTTEIRNIKNNRDRSRYAVPTVTFIIGSVIASLVIYALTHR